MSNSLDPDQDRHSVGPGVGHVDLTMTRTSNGIVIRRLPNGGLSFLPPGH